MTAADHTRIIEAMRALLMGFLLTATGCGGCGAAGQCTLDTDCALGERCGSENMCVPLVVGPVPDAGVVRDSGGPMDAGAPDSAGPLCAEAPMAYPSDAGGARCADPTPTCITGCGFRDGGTDDAGTVLDGGETVYAERSACVLGCAAADTVPPLDVLGVATTFDCEVCSVNAFLRCVYESDDAGLRAIDAYLCCGTANCPEGSAPDCVATMCGPEQDAVAAHPASLGCLDVTAHVECY